MCVSIFCTRFFLKQFLLQEELSEIWSKMYIDSHVKYPLFLSDFNELELFRQILEKYSNIKFHENSSNESRVAACGWSGRWTDGRTYKNDEANSRSSQVFQRA